MARHREFFDLDDRMKRLSDLGDQLEAYKQALCPGSAPMGHLR